MVTPCKMVAPAIGENAVAAAGGAVSKDGPANTVVGGIQAKHIKNI